jgi:hypothetical protein
LHLSGEAKGAIPGAVAKASPNRACQSLGADPKLGELPMTRRKAR